MANVPMIGVMRASLVILGLVAAVGSLGAGVVASAHARDGAPPAGSAAAPADTCSLPGTVPCNVDFDCAAFDAVCDTVAMACVCAVADLGTTDLGLAADLATPDLALTGDGGGGSSSAGGPASGGGMVAPPKSAGCSFVPGSPE